MLNYEMIQSFFVNNGYVFELLSGIWLYCHFFKRKKLFLIRVLVVMAVLVTHSMLWTGWKAVHSQEAWLLATGNIIKYVGDFCLGYFGIMFCMDSEFYSTLFCMICATATQHCAYRIYAGILTVIGLGFDSIASTFIILAVLTIVYFCMYLVLVRRVKQHPERCFDDKMNIVIGGIMILFTIVLHFLLEPFVSDRGSKMLHILISAYDIICCVFVLMIEHGMFRNKVLANDKEILEHLIHKQEEQYEISRENVEIINIKCHDMKYQISKMAGTTDPESLKELERIISIYDASLKTGNEILDVCLMEKKLICEKNSIKLNCIANGSCLAFMQASDVFSLFGNALENAIEAVCKIEDIEKRIISLNVKTQLDMVVIHVENNFEGDLIFADSLPRTTKGDESFHGYGMKSIRLLTEKYKGHVALLLNEGVFNLNIVIPVPDI